MVFELIKVYLEVAIFNNHNSSLKFVSNESLLKISFRSKLSFLLNYYYLFLTSFMKMFCDYLPRNTF